MTITLKRTEEQLELLKAMGSKNRDVAYEAQAALGSFMGPILAEVINNAPALSNLFTTLSFNPDDNPSIPLDLYYDITAEDYITVYSQSMPGGLPTNHVAPTASEMKFTTYNLDSAVSFDKKYAAKSRLDVVGKTFTRVAQEILLKQERTSANLILGTLADTQSSGIDQTLTSKSAGRFLLADLNALITQSKRVNESWSRGTPLTKRSGVTDLLVSPEVIEDIRGMAYNPINTKTASGSTPVSQGAAWVTAPDDIRRGLFNDSGAMSSFFGVNLMEIYQLGPLTNPGNSFTKIFNGLGTFAAGRNDLVLGLDLSRDSLFRAVVLDSDSGSEFTLAADDQYSVRQQKIGYYGAVEEGRMVLDKRAIFGVMV
jgi:hypothetical protein|tara:strand:+ start:58 stop:1167 length:1110 start_codon:yes stop_codon:yes gene_type:complete